MRSLFGYQRGGPVRGGAYREQPNLPSRGDPVQDAVDAAIGGGQTPDLPPGVEPGGHYFTDPITGNPSYQPPMPKSYPGQFQAMVMPPPIDLTTYKGTPDYSKGPPPFDPSWWTETDPVQTAVDAAVGGGPAAQEGYTSNLTVESPPPPPAEPTDQQMASLAVAGDDILMGSSGTDRLEGADPDVQLDEFTRRNAILQVVRNNYYSSKKRRTDVAKLLNTIISMPKFSDVRPDQNDRGYMELLRNHPASVLNLQGVYNNQANPFYNNPELFNNALRREQMKIKSQFWEDVTGSVAGAIPIVPGVSISVDRPRGDEFSMDLYGPPEAVSPEGSEFIASKYGEKPGGGQLYWDSTANNGAGGFQYSRTTSESFINYKNRLIRASVTGLVEFPVTAISLAHLANIGISNAAYNAMTTKEFIFRKVEEMFGEQNFEQSNAKKYLDLALEGSPDEAALFAEGIGVTQKDVMEFRQKYGEVLQPLSS